MLRSASILVLLLFTTSCAYGYAGKEGKRRTTEKEVNPSVKVVEVKEDEDDTETSQPDQTETVTSTEPESPCGVETFEIFFYNSSTRTTKTLDCKSRRVSDVEEASIAGSAYDEAKKAGLPEGSWYILVDPKGSSSRFLNNDQLLRISRQFEIEYFGRESEQGLLVYTFDEDI